MRSGYVGMGDIYWSGLLSCLFNPVGVDCQQGSVSLGPETPATIAGIQVYGGPVGPLGPVTGPLTDTGVSANPPAPSTDLSPLIWGGLAAIAVFMVIDRIH